MQLIKTGAAPTPYRLVAYNRGYEVIHEQLFYTKDELAEAAYSASWYVKDNQRNNWYGGSPGIARQSAFSPNGKLLNIDELVTWGARLRAKRYMSRYMQGYVYRQGSVPGIGGWRGGPSDRAYRVQSERRLNELVMVEDGEVPARASRRGFGLPDSWDGRPRTRQRCWKAQHKGVKSWAHPPRTEKAK